MKISSVVSVLGIGVVALTGVARAEMPTFTIAVSEYPSWSGTFLTAMDMGLIDGDAG